MQRTQRAFTLIELLIVIAIIAMLLAMILPAYKPVARMIEQARCKRQLKALYDALWSYANEHHRFPPLWSTTEYDDINQVYSDMRIVPDCYIASTEKTTGSFGRRFDTGFGALIWHRTLLDPTVYVCPTCRDDEDPWWHDEPVDVKRSVWFHAAGTNMDPVRSYSMLGKGQASVRADSLASYSMRPGLYPHGPGTIGPKGVKAIMADNFFFHNPKGDPARDLIGQRHASGVNVVYLDGSAQYRTDPILFEGNYDEFTQEEYSGSFDGLAKTRLGLIWTSFDGP